MSTVLGLDHTNYLIQISPATFVTNARPSVFDVVFHFVYYNLLGYTVAKVSADNDHATFSNVADPNTVENR
jgi:hypothetical protein